MMLSITLTLRSAVRFVNVSMVLACFSLAASPLFADPAISGPAFHADPLYPDSNASGRNALVKGFFHPPDSARPWVYWLWLDANTTHEAMTRDLEQMKAKGIQGFILYDTGAGRIDAGQPKMIQDGKAYEFVKSDEYVDAHSTAIPTGPLKPWSEPWIEDMRYVGQESTRLGLKFCLSGGLSDTSGEITQEFGKHKLVWTKTTATGPEQFDSVLPAAPATAPVDPNVPGDRMFFQDVAVLAVPNTPDVLPNQVINLTERMDSSGHLTWSVPSGEWTIIRFSQVATGARNNFGTYADALNPEAASKVFSVTVGRVLRAMTPVERSSLVGIEDDSWESGINTWTTNFPKEFELRRGYDPLPYLPQLAGLSIGTPEQGAGFVRDYNLTISDMTADYHYATYESICKANHLVFFSEAAGPNLHFADLYETSSRVDMPMAEFWYPSYHRPTPQSRFLLRNAANTAHIYGFPITCCEAFTSIGPQWEETPFTMKQVADQAFCDGLNKVCFHNFSHSPSVTAKPGYEYFAGTHYEPGITWWEQTPAFNDYLARCSYLLQQGKFLADALFYKGDNLGDGEPYKTIPPTLGDGYDHDNINTEALLNRLSVQNGRLVLPDGMSYRLLVLPPDSSMPLDALQKIADLVEHGATIVGPPPTGIAGLSQDPNDAVSFDALVTKIWGTHSAATSRIDRSVGQGHLIDGETARAALLEAGVPPDFEQTGVSDLGYIDWIHRQTRFADIYFVSSRWQPSEKILATFRVSGRQPELWDPVSGTLCDARAFTQSDGRTTIPLEFNPFGSIFVIFSRSIKSDAAGAAASNYPALTPVATLDGPWDVHFDPKWGGPDHIVFDSLADWTTRPEPGIRYYSGTAVYEKTFDLPSTAVGSRLILDLGDVHEVCSVVLNGVDLGVVWCKPDQVEITKALKPARNKLKVTVVNLWPNRLIGDAIAPAGTPTFTVTNVHKFGATTHLLPSGLLGPVRLLSVNDGR